MWLYFSFVKEKKILTKANLQLNINLKKFFQMTLSVHDF